MSSTHRVIVLSDMHCGHAAGALEPDYAFRHTNGKDPWRDKMSLLQAEMWHWLSNKIEEMQPVTTVIANADLIDGRGEKSGGVELAIPDRQRQADMAARILARFKASNYILTYGTPYHTGDREDLEDNICKDLRNTKGVKKTKIGAHEWVTINGRTFDVKHFIGSSAVPHTAFTAIARDRLWNLLWTEHDEQPKADIIIRSHVHIYSYCGDGNWEACTTPALQGMGSKFGSRICSRRVNYGFLQYDIDKDGSYQKTAHIADFKHQKAKVLTL